MEIQTRKEAAQLGQTKYYTGKPCKHGHLAQRYVSSGLCISCTADRAKGFRRNVADARSGLIAVTVMVHPDDKRAIEDTASALNMGRPHSAP